jgi:tetratricopeptide (TPR) repeat protein
VGLAAAYTSLASAELAQDQKEKAAKSADEAISIFKELNDVEGEISVLQTKMSILLSSGQGAQAVEAATKAAQLGESAKDQAAVGAARLLEADICMDLCRPADAVKAATEAQKCYAAVGNKREEAKAYLVIAYADMNNEYGEAVAAAHAAAEIYKSLGDVASQANAIYTAATAHIAALAIKQRSCLVPCQVNTRGGIDAAKQAADLFGQIGNDEGARLAMQALRTV